MVASTFSTRNKHRITRPRARAMALENYRTASRERMWQYDDMWHNNRRSNRHVHEQNCEMRCSSVAKKKKEFFEATKIMIFLERSGHRYETPIRTDT